MPKWVTILDHRFPDSNFLNYYSVPGYMVRTNASWPFPEMIPRGPDPNYFYAALFQGPTREALPISSATFELQRTADDIIRLIAIVEVNPAFNTGQAYSMLAGDFNILSVGEFDVVIHNRSVVAASSSEAQYYWQPMVKYQGTDILIPSTPIPINQSSTLVLEWNISGLCTLSMNGQVISYRNDVSPGSKLIFNTVVMGTPLVTSSTYPFMHFGFHGNLHLVNVKILRQKDIEKSIYYHPDIDICDILKLQDCIQKYKNEDAKQSMESQIFMLWNKYLQLYTENQSTVENENYLSKTADFHKMTRRLGQLFKLALVDWKEYGEKFFELLRDFLKEMFQMEEAQEFVRDMIQQSAKYQMDDECEKVFDEFFEKYSEILDPILKINRRMVQLMTSLVGRGKK